MTTGKKPLTFKVASHIVEDLGLNLYTSLPRVLVEFVANAYDADSPTVEIGYDRQAIEKQRKVVKADFDREKALAGDELEPETPLALRALPESVTITIRDAGIGMSREDLQEKFLITGRRRRLLGETTTPNGRAVMGRKGLGKLAGFGVAKRVTITSRPGKTATATKIILDYDELVKSKTTDGVIVPEETVNDAKVLPDGGTLVVLSRLLYDPMKSREQTIENEIADHFALIDPKNFKITVNAKQIKPTPREHVYAWPDPGRPADEFVSKTLTLSGEEGGVIDFKYRMRFTDESLRAADRGVRVYANKRLAASPSLLDAETGMHGFRMTDYLDAVVHADFIDEQPIDYIATDRHGLRWDAPMLAELRDFLSSEIKEACKKYQSKRDADKDKEVKDDSFTKQQIEQSGLVSSDRKVAMLVAKSLGRALELGVRDDTYKQTLPALVQAIGHGSILTAISKIADDEHPHLARLVSEITRLTKDELESFTRRAKARLTAIRALKRVVEAVDFRAAENEKELQRLFEKSPWLIDPTYTQFLSADTRADSMFDRLAKHLEIDQHAPPALHPEKRPDLVFALGNTKLGRLVIVELKSANKHLDSSHLEQLEVYMEEAEQWLAQHGHDAIKIEGHLIGSLAPPTARGEKVIALNRRIKKAGPNEPWRVRDYLDVLRDTEAAHQELLEVQAAAPASDDDDEDD